MSLVDKYNDFLTSNKNYSYLYELIEMTSLDETSDLAPLINTVELFSFGNINHYYKYNKQYQPLNKYQLIQLIKLSLWDIISYHDGGEMSYDEILNNEGIMKGIHELGEQPFFIEHLLIEMNYDSIDIRIDQENNKIKVLEILKLRDTYDEKLYKLRILEPNDVKPINDYKGELNQWSNKIKLIIQEYSIPEASDLRSRKRKTSDNHAY